MVAQLRLDGEPVPELPEAFERAFRAAEAKAGVGRATLEPTLVQKEGPRWTLIVKVGRGSPRALVHRLDLERAGDDLFQMTRGRR